MYDVAEGAANRSYVHHPSPTRGPDFPADVRHPARPFKKDFLERLAVELAQQHIDHKPDSGIAEGR